MCGFIGNNLVGISYIDIETGIVGDKIKKSQFNDKITSIDGDGNKFSVCAGNMIYTYINFDGSWMLKENSILGVPGDPGDSVKIICAYKCMILFYHNVAIIYEI